MEFGEIVFLIAQDVTHGLCYNMGHKEHVDLWTLMSESQSA